MFRLSYVSTVRGAVDDAVLDDILATSRANNFARSVTGLLIYDGKRFLQYLEGEEADVTATYERIGSDPRHFAVVELSRGESDMRQFPDWDMAWRRVDGDAALAQSVADMVETCDPALAAELLGFASVRGAA